MIITKVIIIAFVIISIGCGNNNSAIRKPQVEILGDKRWFNNSTIQKNYLLQNFQTDFSKELDWPPDDLCNFVDISMDLTGSVFYRQINFNGRIMPLASYNLQKLKNYLKTNNIFEPGDIVTLRLFGENKSGLSIREEYLIRYPKLKIKLRGSILTRKFNDLQIQVDRVDYSRISIEDFVECIHNWFSKYIQNRSISSYSPILNHIKSVVSSYSQKGLNVKKTFIFVTDGWEELEDIKFWPRYYINDGTLKTLKDRIEILSLKPFKRQYDFIKVIIMGLNFENNYEFKNAQIELFEWFFEPQTVTLLYY